MNLSLNRQKPGFFCAHFPGIVLPAETSFKIGVGTLAHLDFETWYELDEDYCQPVDYGDTMPVFLTGIMEAGDDDKESFSKIYHRIQEYIADVYQAFLLCTILPLPSSKLSCIYLTGSKVYVGDCGREWILGGRYKGTWFNIDNQTLAGVLELYNFLKACKPYITNTGVMSAIDTLALTSTPEIILSGNNLNFTDQFIHCIAALENLLLPNNSAAIEGFKITTTFGRNLAFLIFPTFEECGEKSLYCSELYRLRSRMVHGEISLSSLTENENEMLGAARLFLCKAIICTMALLKFRKGYVVIPDELESASKNTVYFNSLNEQIQKGCEL